MDAHGARGGFLRLDDADEVSPSELQCGHFDELHRWDARFGVKLESLDRCRSAIEGFVSYVRDHEPGTKRYLSLEDV